MYIVYENENNIEQLRSKYLVLELDTVEIKEGEFVTAHCVITTEQVLLQEIATLNEKARLHANLIKNYKSQNWHYCEEALGHLVGSFKGEVDSFYNSLAERINELKDAELSESWTGSITPSNTIA